MRLGERCLMDRIAEARGVAASRRPSAARIGSLDALPDAALLRRAYLRDGARAPLRHVAGRGHLATVLALPERSSMRACWPARQEPADSGPASVRTRHPVVAASACTILAPDDAERGRDGRRPARRAPGAASRTRTFFHIRPS